MYIVWARKRNDPTALWFDMPYAPRSKSECESLVEYYESEWGSLYDYEIHTAGRFGSMPKGTRQPCYVGIND